MSSTQQFTLSKLVRQFSLVFYDEQLTKSRDLQAAGSVASLTCLTLASDYLDVFRAPLLRSGGEVPRSGAGVV